MEIMIVDFKKQSYLSTLYYVFFPTSLFLPINNLCSYDGYKIYGTNTIGEMQ